MRKTKQGIRNKQDWDIVDHGAAGHANVAPPLTLARANLITSIANLETVTDVILKAIDENAALRSRILVLEAENEKLRKTAQNGQN